VLSQPLIAEQPEISWTLHERRECRGDSGEHDDSDVNPEHRRTPPLLLSPLNQDECGCRRVQAFA